LLSGADVAQLHALAARLDQQSAKLREIASSSSAAILVAEWTGAEIDSLRSDWSQKAKPSILYVSGALSELAHDVRKHAEEQRAASAAAGGATVRDARRPVEAAPDNVRGVIADLKDLQAANSLYSIREVVGEDGKTRLIISLPGTKGDATDFSNWGQLGGWGDNKVYMTKDSAALRAVIAQLRAELANYADAEIMMVGYSQGGMLAQLVAASGEFNVTEVLTVGSPRIDDGVDYGNVNVTRIEHNADPIVGGTEYLDGSVFGDAGRDFRSWLDGTAPENAEVNFRAGNPLENLRLEDPAANSVHDIGTGDYDWVADQFQNSTDPAHVAARERLDAFLDGSVVDVSYVGSDGARTGGVNT
jgi:pimeloyl-ACP methyl ester carboxylesterase